ncbi:MAG: hypothetical protein J6I49_01330, partial [Bacteroidales bacterium]|nr:hypothetical protein [Bacteroidales bacterium]
MANDYARLLKELECNDPRKLDKKLSGFCYEQKTQCKRARAGGEKMPFGQECETGIQGVRH